MLSSDSRHNLTRLRCGSESDKKGKRMRTALSPIRKSDVLIASVAVYINAAACVDILKYHGMLHPDSQFMFRSSDLHSSRLF